MYMWTLFQTFGAGLAAFLFMGGLIVVLCAGIGDLARGSTVPASVYDSYLNRYERWLNDGAIREDEPQDLPPISRFFTVAYAWEDATPAQLAKRNDLWERRSELRRAEEETREKLAKLDPGYQRALHQFSKAYDEYWSKDRAASRRWYPEPQV